MKNLNFNDEEEDIIIDETPELKKYATLSASLGNSSLNSESNCAVSSVEAKPFYPTRKTSNSIWEPNSSDN